MSTPKLWRGQTLQDRTSERREQFLEVGVNLLGTAGAAAVTMRAVTREANLSPRYFYETFDSREDLLVAVYNMVEQQLIARLTEVVIANGMRPTLRSVFEAFGDFFDEDPRRARILLREPLADDVLHAHSVGRTPVFIRSMLPMLGAEVGGLAPLDDTELAVMSTALLGALVALYLEYADGRLPVTREKLPDLAAAIVYALASVGNSRNDG